VLKVIFSRNYMRLKKCFMAVSMESISFSNSSDILSLRQLLSALIIWSVIDSTFAFCRKKFTKSNNTPKYFGGRLSISFNSIHADFGGLREHNGDNV